jgi:probable F420-dependent oxidoreductase
MLIGLGAPVSGAWASPENVARFATLAEDLGYHSAWTFQRLLVPADNGMAPVYRSVLDPIVTLAYAAANTTRLRLGVAVVNLPFVPPAVVAKQAATLDVLSAGRLDLGLGLGWSEPEFAATGASLRRRGARAEEYLAVLRTLWTDEVSRFDGRFYTVPASRMAPKPVQRPGPPVLLGGYAEATLERAGRAADGWVSGSTFDLARIGHSARAVRAAAEKAGKDPARTRIVCRGVLRPGRRDGALTGSYAEVRADAERLARLGVTELFYDLNWHPDVGSPDADPAAATDLAEEILRALAPVSGATPP